MNAGIYTPLLRRCLLAATMIVSTLMFLPSPAPASTQAAFTFNGGGWGHGIGMSQYGARGYALQGKDYRWILSHYYQDTALVTKPSVVVSVNLDKSSHSRTSWRVTAGKDVALTFIQLSDSAKKTTLDGSKRYWVTVSSGNTRVHADSSGKPGKVLRTFSGACYAKAGDSLEGSLVQILSTSGPFGHSGVRWRGYIRFAPDGTSKSKAVNRVRIEDYLRGVVPRESPSSWPSEALKAQAVAARSYAYEDARAGRTIWCTTMSQVYNGHSRPAGTHEAASTNTAIDATTGQLVWYRGQTKPVKTFFFSSSGGHTANIEDVWTASAAQPYYTGVKDADKNGNPYYTWTVGPLDTSSVSSKVRAKVGASYSAASPHTITSMSTDRASSGFTRSVTVRWSNGRSYKIRGDTMRSALGLRSTKFGIVTKSSVESYQQTSKLLGWSGRWAHVPSSSSSGGSYRQSSTPSSRGVFKFKGTGVTWIGSKGPKGGKVEVKLDGRVIATVDQYAARQTSRQRIFSRTGLTSGEHTLVFKVLSERNPKSGGRATTVDRVDVTGGSLVQAPTPASRYQESYGRVAKLGGWQTVAGEQYLGGGHIVNSRDGAKIVLDFIGTGIRWIGSKGPDYGSATVRIDDGTPTTVSLNAKTDSDKRAVFASSKLATNTRHRMVIEVAGGGSASPSAVSVDQLEVIGGWAYAPDLAVRRFQQTQPRIAKSGSWKTAEESGSSGGSHIVTNGKGSTVNVRFEGTSISWIGARSPRSGRAAVYLDGTKVATVDQYGSTIKYRQKLFTKTGLSAGPHRLEIRVLGTKRATASGAYINVDAFDIAGDLAP